MLADLQRSRIPIELRFYQRQEQTTRGGGRKTYERDKSIFAQYLQSHFGATDKSLLRSL